MNVGAAFIGPSKSHGAEQLSRSAEAVGASFIGTSKNREGAEKLSSFAEDVSCLVEKVPVEEYCLVGIAIGSCATLLCSQFMKGIDEYDAICIAAGLADEEESLAIEDDVGCWASLALLVLFAFDCCVSGTGNDPDACSNPCIDA